MVNTYLKVITPEKVLYYELKDQLRFGRNARSRQRPRVDIKIDDKKISLEHALFYRDGNGYIFVKDLGAKNGVDLNGTLVQEERILIGDIVKIGATVVEIEKERLSFIERAILGIRTSMSRKGITFIRFVINRCHLCLSRERCDT